MDFFLGALAVAVVATAAYFIVKDRSRRQAGRSGGSSQGFPKPRDVFGRKSDR